MQIYMTINRLSGKFYIGKNKNCYEHYLGSGLYINRAINKHGRENFYKIILETVDNVELLNEREKHWIEHYRKTQSELMYNIGCGGEWGDVFTNHPRKEEIRKKIAKAKKTYFKSEENLKKNRIAQKISHSRKEVRKKLSDSIKLKYKNAKYLEEYRKRIKIVMSNPEVRKKISNSGKLRFQNQDNLDAHRNRLKLCMSNPEVRKKMSDSAKAKFENAEYLAEHRKRIKISNSNPEVRKKISDAAKAYGLKSCSIDGITYNVVWDAVHALGIKNKEIRRRCKSEEYPTYFYI